MSLSKPHEKKKRKRSKKKRFSGIEEGRRNGREERGKRRE